jgi:hypothetical protein
MGGARNITERARKCLQNVIPKNWKETITCGTYVWKAEQY